MVVEMDNFWWEDSSCFAPEVQHNTVAVICQYDIGEISTTTTTATSTTTSIPEPTTVTKTTAVTEITTVHSCPSGWQEFGGHCYLLVKPGETWANAEKDCYNKGGHLASVHSADENTFISLLPGGDIWLGASDADVEVVTHIHA
jgi:hypothetical protein